MRKTTSNMTGGRPHYNLAEPWHIGSNLEPSVSLADGSEIIVWHDPEHQGNDGRITYDYEVRDSKYWTVASGEFHSGVGDKPDLDRALSSLLDFADTHAEAVEAVGRTGPDIGQSGQFVALGRWYSEHRDELQQYQDLYKNQMQDDEEFSRISSGLDVNGQVPPFSYVPYDPTPDPPFVDAPPDIDERHISVDDAYDRWAAAAQGGERYTDAEIADAAVVTEWQTMDPDGSIRPLTEIELADFTEKVRASEPARQPGLAQQAGVERGMRR